jgi:flagellar FliL protein
VVGALALIGGGVGGAWYFGALPAGLLFGGAEVPSPPGPASPSAILIEIPDIIANLNAGGRPVFVKIRAQVELARPADAAAARAAMPRLLDMFNTFLRETRPEELRGSTGVHRLREELVSRANIILRDGAVTDVLFLEIVVQ